MIDRVLNMLLKCFYSFTNNLKFKKNPYTVSEAFIKNNSRYKIQKVSRWNHQNRCETPKKL